MKLDLGKNSALPQYVRISQHIREQIEAKVLQPGDRLPSFSEMKQRFGINKYTLERAQALLEQEGLIVREHGRGTFVAQPGRRPRTGLIAFSDVTFIHTDFSSYWLRLFEAVEEVANAAETQLLLLRGNSLHGWDKVDGILLNGMQIHPHWPSVKTDLPCVCLLAPPVLRVMHEGTVPDNWLSGRRHKINTVVADDYAGMRQATEHLISLGHRRIAYLNNRDIDNVAYPVRRPAYEATLRTAGVEPDPRWLRALPSPFPLLHFRFVGREGMRQWLQDDWRELGCTALIAHNDETALGAIEALQEAGLSVPDDVSVVGFDDTDICSCSEPQLTSVNVPLREIGQVGMELLLRKIEEGPSEGETIVLPTTLQVRASTAPPRVR